MNETSAHIWWKRIVSLVGAGYTALICWFSYLSIFYELSIPNKVTFCAALSVLSLVALITMLYSRFQILTRLSGFLLLPAAFPLIMLCFGEWELILPIAITALLIFFLSGAGETPKTIFGVIYLLLYLLGSLAYFMVISFFASSTQQTVLESGVSLSGAYRYEVIQTDDSSGGDIEVHVAPNDRDITLPFVTFEAVGYDRVVYMERPASTEDISAQWTTATRSEITADLLEISADLELDLTDEQKELLGIASNVETVYLRNLTDSDLELLGIPEENDVMTFRGQVCFRTYIAVLEDYFATENRELTILD